MTIEETYCGSAVCNIDVLLQKSSVEACRNGTNYPFIFSIWKNVVKACAGDLQLVFPISGQYGVQSTPIKRMLWLIKGVVLEDFVRLPWLRYWTIYECLEFTGNWVCETQTRKPYGKRFYLTKMVVKEVFMLKAGQKSILIRTLVRMKISPNIEDFQPRKRFFPSNCIYSWSYQ